MDIRTRLNQIGRSPQAGLAFLALGLLSTVIWLQDGSTLGVEASNGASVHPGTGVKLQATLSQPMIVQGADGTIYLDIRIDTPEMPARDRERTPSDILIVLDRSGSMGEGSKWAYATRAVHSLLDRLDVGDRVGLITFDTSAQVVSQLVPATAANLTRLHGIVDRLQPGASTNLGHGLLTAESLITRGLTRETAGVLPGLAGESERIEVQYRRRRVLLLSDGQANVGIVDPGQLGALARRLADRGAVVSTIGMGLGFNETLMASLADLGMGSFSYLEHLESLGSILAGELQDSRSVFADGSHLTLELPQGVDLVEAAGYPFEFKGRRAEIRTGQLLRGTEKRFMATLRVDNRDLAEYHLGALELEYRSAGRSYRQRIRPGSLQVACIPPEREQEALESVDTDVYQEAWKNYNVGSLMRQISDFVRSGQREAAVDLMEAYRDRLDEADAVVPGLKKEAAAELQELEDRVNQAFQGPDQKVRQNRAAKSLLGASQERQRAVEKKQ